MADGTIKRHDTDPSLVITLTNTDGTNYDLTGCVVNAIMYYPTTLSTTINDAVTTVPVNSSCLGIAEVSDLLLIGNERFNVTVVPTTLNAGNLDLTVAARPYTIPAVAGKVYGSGYVSGTGTNIFVLGGSATFDLSYDGNAPATVTLTAASTSTNYLMSHLVTDLQASCDAAVGANTTVSNTGNRFIITSKTTGTASSIKITSPNAYATAELGISAASDYGEASVACTAAAHTAADVVNLIKFERRALLSSTPSDGTITLEWLAADTNNVGTFYFEFEVKTSQGRYFTIPFDSTTSITVQVIADINDRSIKDGE
jgi:hypothetical protein